MRDLVHALHDLYRDAGIPSMRMISIAVRHRPGMPDTVSHETVGQMLRGESVPGWSKFECVVRYMAGKSVHAPDVEAEVERFHQLWLAAVSPGTAETTQPQETRSLPSPSMDLSGELPPRNVWFVGREHLVRTIHEVLRTGAPVVTVTGIGGVGKTQLAIEYLHRYRDQYDLVWWVPAENPSQLRTSLALLGNRLGLPRSEDAQHPPRQVVAALARSSLRWLLVFDDAGSPGSMPSLRDLGSGRVLLTSRDPDWADHGSVLEVGVFDRAESVRLLADRADVTRSDAERVAARLGDLPLAVEQVAWHLATGVPVASYLDDLDKQLHAILDDDRTKAAGYPATVPGFLHVAFTRLAESAPAAAQLLELFAWLGAEPLSLTLLRSGRQGAVTATLREALRHAPTLNQAVRDLRRHGLVVLIEGEPERIGVHAVFQRVLQDWLGETRLARGRANVQAILAAANPGEPDDSRFWGHYAEVGPHIIAADLANAEDFEARRVVLDQVRYLYRIGHYQQSADLGRQLISSVNGTNASEADHHVYVLARHHLGNAMRMQGRYSAARQVTLEALEHLGNHPEFGPELDYTADLDKNRGADLRIFGRYDNALTVDEASLHRQQRNDINDQDKIRTIRNNIAVSLRLLGRFAEARAIDSEIVRQWTDARGPSDPRTLFARCNLARDLYGLGRYAETLSEVRAVLPVYQTVVGAHHHGVLLAVRTEVMALRKLGRIGEALPRAQQNRDDLSIWFGEHHEYTLAAGISLINTWLASGDLGAATVEMPKLLDRCTRIFGEDHPMTLAVLVNSASVLRAFGDVAGARRRDEDASAALTGILGADHPYTLCADHNLAVDLARLGEEAKALAMAASVLERSRATRGEDHPDTLACAAAQDGRWVECDIEPPPT
ncbi:FxSxx-COOH system tetratricopeptide repeat protein [Actinocrispum sp. NPDC049592]|uniref:FxSxx-COOH system tetratricopeptide repeat protein n=1 Tax=Actinocrispum sp. NPDC049592 TaxID=3154835 RepID=UPI003415C74F